MLCLENVKIYILWNYQVSAVIYSWNTTKNQNQFSQKLRLSKYSCFPVIVNTESTENFLVTIWSNLLLDLPSLFMIEVFLLL